MTVLCLAALASLIAAQTGLIATLNAQGDMLQVTGIAGQSVLLPCRVQTSSDQQDHAVLVLWYKAANTTLLYSFNAPSVPDGTREDNKRPELVRETQRRAQFLWGSSSALRLDPLLPKDGAVYRCRVDFSRGPTHNTYINLTVLVAPQSPTIMYKGQAMTSGRLGPLIPTDRVTLVCVSDDGRPPASLSFYSRNRLLNSSSRVELAAERSDWLRKLTATANHHQHHQQRQQQRRRQWQWPRSVITTTLPQLTREHNPLNVTCRAHNTASSAPAETTVEIAAYFAPNMVEIEKQSLSAVLANRTYTVSCRAGGSFPPANITWTLNGRILTGAMQKVTGDPAAAGRHAALWTESSVDFRPLRSDHSGQLSCSAHNSYLATTAAEASLATDTHTLSVRFAPFVEARLGYALDSEMIKEGVDVYFDCHIEANPKHYEVVWLYNNVTLSASNDPDQLSDLVSMTTTSLVIRNLTRRSSGLYSCRASNTEGHGVSRSVPLSVKHAPVCETNQRKRYGVDLHETVQVRCQVNALPDRVSFRWQFNNSVETLDLPAAQVKSSAGVSVIGHRPRSSADFGSLLCWAVNDIGRMSQPCVFQVNPPAVPEPVHHCVLLNETASSLTVECEPGDDGGAVQTFHAHLFDLRSGSLLRNATTGGGGGRGGGRGGGEGRGGGGGGDGGGGSEIGVGGRAQFVFDNLPATASGSLALRVHVFATNSHGRSRVVALPDVQLVAATGDNQHSVVGGTQGEVTSPTDISLAPLYGVFIGVALSLLAVAVGATICLRRGSARKQMTRTDILTSSAGHTKHTSCHTKTTTTTAAAASASPSPSPQQQQQQQQQAEESSWHQLTAGDHADHANPDLIPTATTGRNVLLTPRQSIYGVSQCLGDPSVTRYTVQKRMELTRPVMAEGTAQQYVGKSEHVRHVHDVIAGRSSGHISGRGTVVRSQRVCSAGQESIV